MTKTSDNIINYTEKLKNLKALNRKDDEAINILLNK